MVSRGCSRYYSLEDLRKQGECLLNCCRDEGCFDMSKCLELPVG